MLSTMKIRFIIIATIFCLSIFAGSDAVYSDEMIPEYNIWITNKTDNNILDVDIIYGEERFKIELIESSAFKWRSFVNYAVPEIIICKWKDTEGTIHSRKAKIPPYKLDVDHTANLFISIGNGNNIIIEWKST